MNGIELLKRIRLINPTTRVTMVIGNTNPVLARGPWVSALSHTSTRWRSCRRPSDQKIIQRS